MPTPRKKKAPSSKKKAAAPKPTTRTSPPTQQRRTKPAKMSLGKAPAAATPTRGELEQQITRRFQEIGGWRAETLRRTRGWILTADPALVEERKWIKPSNPFGVLAYSRSGLVLTLEVYKEYVKVTFATGSEVPDPTAIFNASLLGLRRAVDIREGDSLDEDKFKALVRAAVAVNVAKRG